MVSLTPRQPTLCRSASRELSSQYQHASFVSVTSHHAALHMQDCSAGGM